ncbi:putative collagen-binding domain-containing protein [Streptomyces sp. NPDC004752]
MVAARTSSDRHHLGGQRAHRSATRVRAHHPRRSSTVVYYPHRLDGGKPCTGKRTGLTRGAYTLEWFDPRTGEYTPAGSVDIADAQGTAQLPPEPTAADDWALLVTRSAQ